MIILTVAILTMILLTMVILTMVIRAVAILTRRHLAGLGLSTRFEPVAVPGGLLTLTL